MQDGPHNKNHLAQTINNTEVEKPCHRVYSPDTVARVIFLKHKLDHVILKIILLSGAIRIKCKLFSFQGPIEPPLCKPLLFSVSSFCSFKELQDQWAFIFLSNFLNFFLFQGLCTCCYFCLEQCSLAFCLVAVSSFRSQVKCHLLCESFLVFLSKIGLLSTPVKYT